MSDTSLELTSTSVYTKRTEMLQFHFTMTQETNDKDDSLFIEEFVIDSEVVARGGVSRS